MTYKQMTKEKVAYKAEITVDAKDTDTQGKHAYVVALCCGGLMEDPEIHYEDHQVILADSAEEARQKYNDINNCSYFYGEVVGRIK